MGELRLDGGKSGQMAFHTAADFQNHAIGWPQKGCSSFGGRTVVRFPRIWMSSGSCRLKGRWGERLILVVELVVFLLVFVCFRITLVLATAPIPLLVLFGLVPVEPLLERHGIVHDLLRFAENLFIHD